MSSTTDAVTYWQDVYAARPAATDPRPNVRLTETVTSLPPGDALDLGCGNGGDALWLARQGWHVTAVDISAVAVERLAGLARSHGLGDRLTSVQHDLAVQPDLHDSFPQGEFDLICAHYLHTPSTWTGQPSCAGPRTRCGWAGSCWSSTMARPRRGRGTRIPTSTTRPPRRSPRASIWTRRRGRSSGPSHPAGSPPDRTGRPPRSPTMSCSSAEVGAELTDGTTGR